VTDWTQIAITAITTFGGLAATIVSARYATRSRGHAVEASASADRAIEASLRPPPPRGAELAKLTGSEPPTTEIIFK
jgi:hypothetical protein